MTAQPRPRFVLFGDSITQQSFRVGGWGARLADRYDRTADLANRGYSGYNTRWALRLLPSVFPKGADSPTLVTILFGANDAQRPSSKGHQPETDGLQHVPLDEYSKNLAEIVACVRSVGCSRVLLITPPPVDEATWAAETKKKMPGLPADAEPNRTTAVTAEYAAACVKVGAETETPVLDLNTLLAARADWRGLFSDGLHPSEAGGEAMHALIDEAISTHFPELRPSFYDDPEAKGKMALDFPDWKQLMLQRTPEAIDGAFAAHEEARVAAFRASGLLG